MKKLLSILAIAFTFTFALNLYSQTPTLIYDAGYMSESDEVFGAPDWIVENDCVSPGEYLTEEISNRFVYSMYGSNVGNYYEMSFVKQIDSLEHFIGEIEMNLTIESFSEDSVFVCLSNNGVDYDTIQAFRGDEINDVFGTIITFENDNYKYVQIYSRGLAANDIYVYDFFSLTALDNQPTVSVEDLTSDFSVYSSNSSVVVNTNVENYELHVYNVNGQIVYTTIDSYNSTVSLNESGLYIVRIRKNNSEKVVKLML